jgi:CheY-like chemotaxis protein
MSPPNAPRVLVVEDSRTQAEEIRLLLEESGFAVTLVGDGQDALDSLAQGLPDLIATDLQMPRLNGLQLVDAVRRKYPSVPVVLITAHGSEVIASKALRKGAASYVPKSVLEQDLVPTLENILTVTQAERHQQRALECLTQCDSAFVLDNDVSRIAPLLGYLDSLLARLKLCDPTERMRVGVALQEALVNAIYHGNLEVNSELRQQDERIYHDVVCRRRELPPYRDRRVYFRACLTPAEAVFTIRDEGPGFDPSKLPDPTDPAALERVGGRGLLLIRTFMDRFEHNQAGNEIILVKQRT